MWLYSVKIYIVNDISIPATHISGYFFTQPVSVAGLWPCCLCLIICQKYAGNKLHRTCVSKKTCHQWISAQGSIWFKANLLNTESPTISLSQASDGGSGVPRTMQGWWEEVKMCCHITVTFVLKISFLISYFVSLLSYFFFFRFSSYFWFFIQFF